MVDLWKELKKREARRMEKAKAIMDNRVAIGIMVLCFGLSAFFLGTAFDHADYGTTQRFLFGIAAPLLVVVQLVLVGTLWWARRVINRGTRKL